ncbi:MAG: PTS IIA-like nitrogen regulatory protein PtsN [Rhodospirillaceae bacterium]
MEIEDILKENCVVTSLKATSKKQALQELANRASRLTGLEEREIFDVLLERERLGTTGVGSGIAIPHGKLPQLETLFGCFARLDEPVDFDSVDNQPVDLIFLLLAPESAGADHLKALARISRVLRNNASCDKLRSAASANAIYDLLTADAQSRAA